MCLTLCLTTSGAPVDDLTVACCASFIFMKSRKNVPPNSGQFFYRAMHVLLARNCYRKSSVRLSVRLSVTLMYRGHIGWTSSKLITGIISLRLRSTKPQHRQSSPRGTPLKFGWNMGGVVLSRKPAISLKRGKIGPRLLLMTNRKSHTRFRSVPKSMILDDLEGPLRTSKHVRLSEPTTKI